MMMILTQGTPPPPTRSVHHTSIAHLRELRAPELLVLIAAIQSPDALLQRQQRLVDLSTFVPCGLWTRGFWGVLSATARTQSHSSTRQAGTHDVCHVICRRSQCPYRECNAEKPRLTVDELLPYRPREFPKPSRCRRGPPAPAYPAAASVLAGRPPRCRRAAAAAAPRARRD
jgi:hypothetical protein